MKEIKPLKNPLEQRPTIFRVYRSINPDFILNEYRWGQINHKIHTVYKSLSKEPLQRVRQPRIFGNCRDNKPKVFVYPAEFIPVMINIINDYIKSTKRE